MMMMMMMTYGVQVYMALSNCRSNGQGLRLRYRLEVFGYARDDLCASGASAVVSRRSVTVHVTAAAAQRWSSTNWTVRRLAAAVLHLYELGRNTAGVTIVLSLSAADVFAAVRT